MDCDIPTNRRTIRFHHCTYWVDIENLRETVSSLVREKARFRLENSLTAKLQPSRPSQGYIIEEFLSHPKTWDLDQQEQGR